MESERVTRSILPSVSVGMPASLLAWVDAQAKAAHVSRTKWIVRVIEAERERVSVAEFARDDEREEMAS